MNRKKPWSQIWSKFKTLAQTFAVTLHSDPSTPAFPPEVPTAAIWRPGTSKTFTSKFLKQVWPRITAAESKWLHHYPMVEIDKRSPSLRFASPGSADPCLTSASKPAVLMGASGLTQQYLWKHSRREIRRQNRWAPKKTKNNQVCGAAFAAMRLKLRFCKGQLSPFPYFPVWLIQMGTSLCWFFGAVCVL